MPRSRLTGVLSAAAAVFGLLTVASGGMALFGSGATREAYGSVVPFVLWFNFLSGFAYLLAAYGLYTGRRWGGALAVFIATTTVLVFLAFGVAVALGVPFEMRTVAAMSIRSAFWLGVA
ncbi:MAG: hypothetical protein F9K19_02615 [Rhizobiaceae bacterium]|nr:MAG: hypothetical protein F9K19_02615 [Rhizobiaceae bacterium]CAG0960051.1 hypothetical protein RHIZO_00660 [Rhizobiaceae bacterium]